MPETVFGRSSTSRKAVCENAPGGVGGVLHERLNVGRRLAEAAEHIGCDPVWIGVRGAADARPDAAEVR
jgi:hypothetical protein